eukprot:gene19710-biopygen30258
MPGTVPDLTGEHLQKALGRMRPGQAAGMEGWQADRARAGADHVDPKRTGGRADEDVYWDLMLQMEEALYGGQPFCGVSYDYRQCFDQIPQGILLRVVRELGLPDRILAPVERMYRRLRRRFRAAGGVGREFAATNGILQGDPLSVIYLNALVAVWCKAVEA